jgi:hypothetical protein
MVSFDLSTCKWNGWSLDFPAKSTFNQLVIDRLNELLVNSPTRELTLYNLIHTQRTVSTNEHMIEKLLSGERLPLPQDLGSRHFSAGGSSYSVLDTVDFFVHASLILSRPISVLFDGRTLIQVNGYESESTSLNVLLANHVEDFCGFIAHPGNTIGEFLSYVPVQRPIPNQILVSVLDGEYYDPFSDDPTSSDISMAISAGPRVERYHGLPRISKIQDVTNGMFTIGFEVEKEDYHARQEHSAREIFNTTRWAKERDGSLDDDSGYELVSPTYNLFENLLDQDINSDPLKMLINADSTDRCGGHIHFGKSGMSGMSLFKIMSPWIPFIYSIYVGRIHKRHCKVKLTEGILNQEDKYQAIRIFDNRVEFRIISRVRNTTNLLWRRDLFRIIATEITASPMSIVGMLTNKKSDLYKHMAIVYSDAQMAEKLKLYAFFADELLDDNNKLSKESLRLDEMFSTAQIRHLISEGVVKTPEGTNKVSGESPPEVEEYQPARWTQPTLMNSYPTVTSSFVEGTRRYEMNMPDIPTLVSGTIPTQISDHIINDTRSF